MLKEICWSRKICGNEVLQIARIRDLFPRTSSDFILKLPNNSSKIQNSSKH